MLVTLDSFSASRTTQAVDCRGAAPEARDLNACIAPGVSFMKSLLTLTLVVLMAGSAFAQLDNSMGLFFSDSEFIEENTNLDTAGAPFDVHIVLLEATVFSVGGYEVSVELSDAGVFILAVDGPNGWTNFGDNTNHLVGFQTPVPSDSGAALLCTLNMLYSGDATVDMFMGPSDPSSVDGAGPAIADGANPDLLYICNYTSGPDFDGLVATLNGEGIDFPGGVATENQSWSNVKALF
jgi:hypothetical protein